MTDEVELPIEEEVEPVGAMSPATKKRWERHIERVAQALASARKAKPKEDHFTVDRLAKHGAPGEKRAVRRVVQDYRYGLWVALKKVTADQKLPRFKRAPFYEAGCVWL